MASITCTKCEEVHAVSKEQIEDEENISCPCGETLSLPKICPICQYFNRAGRQECFQCKTPLFEDEKKKKEALLPLDFYQRESEKCAHTMGIAFLFFCGVLVFRLTEGYRLFSFFVMGTLLGGLVLSFLCFKNVLVVILLLVLGNIWFLTSQSTYLLQPTLVSYFFACLSVLISLLGVNLLYLWVLKSKAFVPKEKL